MAFRGNATTARSSHDPAGPDEQEARRPRALPQPQQQVLEIQQTLGNQAVAAVLARKKAPQPKPLKTIEKARSGDEVQAIKDDVLWAIAYNEIGKAKKDKEGNYKVKKAIESQTGTASGAAASYATATQMVPRKLQSVLNKMSKEELATLDLSEAERKTAGQIFNGVAKIWEWVVKGAKVPTEDEIREKFAKELLAYRLYEDSDLEKMIAFSRWRKAFRAKIVEEKAKVEGKTADELWAMAPARAKSKWTIGMARKRVEDFRTRVAGQLAVPTAFELPEVSTLGMSYSTVQVYGLGNKWGEDMAGWMRLAIDRPPIKGGANDNIGKRYRAAAEQEGGWKLSRADIGDAVQDYLDEYPLASDDDCARAGARRNSKDGNYPALIVRNLATVRADRGAGKLQEAPWEKFQKMEKGEKDETEEKEDETDKPSGGGTTPEPDTGGGGGEPDEPEGDVEEGGGGSESESETDEEGGGGEAGGKGDWAGQVKAAHNPLVMLPLMFTLTGPLVLGGSVGNGGNNDPGDIAAVIIRLKALGRLEVPTDPAALSAAIYAAQKQLAGMKKGDGVIDASGKTINALNEAWADKQKPAKDDPAPAPAPAPSGGGGDKPAPAPAPAPGTSARPGTRARRGRWRRRLWDDIGGWLEDKLKTDKRKDYSANDLVLTGIVGKKGDNAPADVAAVRDRLNQLGYPAGSSDDELIAAIKAFQRETFVTTKDSRITGRAEAGKETIKDNNETLQALNVAAPRSGSRRKDSDVAAVVMASEDPGVVALRTKITELQGFSGGIKTNANEQQGAERDELVEKIGELRQEIDSLDVSDLDETDAEAVKIWGHRALNKLAPFYSQQRNVDVLENAKGKGVFRTCNITAFAMCLEALGKSPGDFPPEALQPLRDARRFKGEEGQVQVGGPVRQGERQGHGRGRGRRAHDGEDADVLGLRMPDFLSWP